MECVQYVCFRCGEKIQKPPMGGVNKCSCGDVAVFNTPHGVEVAHREGAEYGIERKSA